MYAQSVFHLPLSLQRDESLVDVGSHVWVYVKIECLYSNLVDKPVNLTFQLVGENNARLNLSLSEAGGAYLFHIHIHSRTDTLARNLH